MPDVVDLPDSNINNLLFDQNNEERRSWVFFGQRVARSQVVFLVQVLLIFIVITTSVAKLWITERCEEVTVWLSLLSSSIGYMLPSPHL